MLATMARQRAPRRTGHRTTLTLPEDLLAAAARIAEQLGTTPNDAVVRLAEEAVEQRRRRERIEQVSAQRRAAVRRAARGAPGELAMPDPAELYEAMLAGRREE